MIQVLYPIHTPSPFTCHLIHPHPTHTPNPNPICISYVGPDLHLIQNHLRSPCHPHPTSTPSVSRTHSILIHILSSSTSHAQAHAQARTHAHAHLNRHSYPIRIPCNPLSSNSMHVPSSSVSTVISHSAISYSTFD